MQWFKFWHYEVNLRTNIFKIFIKPKWQKAFSIKRHKDLKHPKYNCKFRQVNKSNPIDKNGKKIICDSKLPWVNKCPHKNDQIAIFLRTVLTILQKAIFLEEVNIVLITEDLSKSQMSKVFKNRPSKFF